MSTYAVHLTTLATTVWADLFASLLIVNICVLLTLTRLQLHSLACAFIVANLAPQIASRNQECMFQTPSPADTTSASIWIVTRHDPDAFEVEMYKVTPGVTGRSPTDSVRTNSWEAQIIFGLSVGHC